MKKIFLALFLVFLFGLRASGSVSGVNLVSMDFDNVELKVIIKYMSELTGKNFIVDGSVKVLLRLSRLLRYR